MEGRDWGAVLYESPLEKKPDLMFFLILIATMVVMLVFLSISGLVMIVTGYEVDGDGSIGWVNLGVGALFSAVFIGSLWWAFRYTDEDRKDPTDQLWTRVYERGLEYHSGPRVELGQDDDRVIPIEDLRSINLSKKEEKDGMKAEVTISSEKDGKTSDWGLSNRADNDLAGILVALAKVRPDLVDKELGEYIGSMDKRHVFTVPVNVLTGRYSGLYVSSIAWSFIGLLVFMNASFFLFDMFPEEIGPISSYMGLFYSVLISSMITYVMFSMTKLMPSRFLTLSGRVDGEDLVFQVPGIVRFFNDVRTSIPISEIVEAKPDLETKTLGHVGTVLLASGERHQVSYEVVEDLASTGRFITAGISLTRDGDPPRGGNPVSQVNVWRTTFAFIGFVLAGVVFHLVLREWVVVYFRENTDAFLWFYGILICAVGCLFFPFMICDWLLKRRYNDLEVTPEEVSFARFPRGRRTVPAADIVELRTAYLFLLRVVRVRTRKGQFHLPIGTEYRFPGFGYVVRDDLGLLQKRLERPSWPWAD